MQNDELKDKWRYVIAKYSVIKKVYILCEELDPELKTNIQPLNEFRAALDHVMKMMADLYENDDDVAFYEQYTKLCSHLNRSFFDICDILSIHYRNNIVKMLRRYSAETIEQVLPEYYSNWDAKINEISLNIANYRNKKGNSSEDEMDLFEKYDNDIKFLNEIYKEIISKKPTLERHSRKKRASAFLKETLIIVVSAIFGGIITYLRGIL